MFWIVALLITILFPLALYLFISLFPAKMRARPFQEILGHLVVLAVLLCWLALALLYAYWNVPSRP